MSRTLLFIRNSLTSVLLQAVVMVSGFVIPKIMIAIYGSEINGLVASVTQIVSFVSLIEMGLSHAMVFSLYKPLANKDKSAINSIVSAAKIFYTRTGFFFLGLLSLAAVVYPIFVKTSTLSNFEVLILFFIAGVNGILEFFTLAKYRVLMTADQRTYVISIATIVQTLLNLLIFAALAYGGFSIIVVKAVATLAIFARSGILWLYCKHKYKFLDFAAKPDYKAIDKRWDAFYLQIVSVVHSSTPIILATFMLSLDKVSVYVIYNLVYAGVATLLSVFVSGLAAGFGSILALDDRKTFKKAFQEFELCYGIIISVIFSTMLILYIPFINLYTKGADIDYTYPLLAILLVIKGITYELKTPHGMLIFSLGAYKESKIQTTIQAAIEFFLGAILCVKFGLCGIVFAAICSNIYRDIDFIFFAPKYLTKYSFGYSLKIWTLVVVVSAIAFAFYFTFKYSPQTFFDWGIYAAAVFAASSLLSLIVFSLGDFAVFLRVIKRLRRFARI